MEVLITDRGKPVARLVPISRPKDLKESLHSDGKTGAHQAWIGQTPKGLLEDAKTDNPEGLVLKALLEEREAGR